MGQLQQASVLIVKIAHLAYILVESLSRGKWLHILVNSTRQWNPGDEFIDIGVRRILARYFNNDDSWHLWNRNPDLSIHPTDNWDFRENLLSNNVTSLLRSLVDVVVFSGSPEWLGPRCDPIYDFLDRNRDIPLLLIGVGSSDLKFEVRDVAKRVLSRENTLILTRGRELALYVNRALGFNKATWLPCPAVLSSDDMGENVQNKRLAAILQVPMGPQSIPSTHFDQVRRALDSCENEIDIIAFHEKECEFLASSFPDRRLRYSEKAETYISWFRQYGGVVSTRLHGALAAVSCGVWSCILQRHDFRVNSTAELIPIVNLLDPILAFQAAVSAITQNSVQERSKISSFKHQAVSDYKAIVHPFMTRAGFPGRSNFCEQ